MPTLDDFRRLVFGTFPSDVIAGAADEELKLERHPGGVRPLGFADELQRDKIRAFNSGDLGRVKRIDEVLGTLGLIQDAPRPVSREVDQPRFRKSEQGGYEFDLLPPLNEALRRRDNKTSALQDLVLFGGLV